MILINRPDGYDRDSPRAGEADLILAKHRNGPIRDLHCRVRLCTWPPFATSHADTDHKPHRCSFSKPLS